QPNAVQFALDRALDAAQTTGDVGVGVAFHFPHSDRLQLGVGELIKKALALFSQLGRQLRGWFAAEKLIDGIGCHEGFRSPPALQVDRFADSYDGQEPPEIIAVLQVRKSPVLCSEA